ncbi:hypothetical protein HMPREF1554_01160 [Porphyromonas gingivalis F0569]|nr:hypothetical protein HMPREF1554_01160 [Porphyromonas gingivalis F0569]
MSSRLTKTDNGSNYECPWGKRFLSLLESLTFLVILITQILPMHSRKDKYSLHC